MIFKLVKHELKASLSSLVGMFIALFVLAIVGPILLNINAEWLSAIVVLAGFALMIAVTVVTIMVIVNLFNKRTFGAQGYLNITLPITTSQLLLSKLITGIIISLLTILASFLAFMTFGLSLSWMVFGGLNPLNYIFTTLSDSGLFAKIGSIILPTSIVSFVGVIYSMSLLLLVVVFIHTSYVRKNKVVVGILSYLGIYLLISTLQTYVLNAEYLIINETFDTMNLTIVNEVDLLSSIVNSIQIHTNWASLGMVVLFYLVLSGILFTIAQYLMEHKLEVE